MGQASSDAYRPELTRAGCKTVIVGDKSAAMRAILQQALSQFGFNVLTTGDAEQFCALAATPGAHLAIIDESLLGDEASLRRILGEAAPDLPVIVTHGSTTASTRHEHPQLRAQLAKPFDLRRLVDLCSETAGGARPTSGDTGAIALVGRSATTQQLSRAFMRLAQTDFPALIVGEPGTGAELVAKELHKRGTRSKGAFAHLDIGALTTRQIAAFPDESVTPMTRGTLYLEEIGDLPLDAQARLLRLLKVESSSAPRLIASTRKDLSQSVLQGMFREDLFYRLNVAPLRLPPLRERLEDLPDLVDAVLKLARRDGLPAQRIEESALECLTQYDWPGNILELTNFLRRLALLYGDEVITAAMVRAELAHEPRRPTATREASLTERGLANAVENYIAGMLRAGGSPPPNLYDRLLREIEAPLFRSVLDATRGNKLKAAQLLGLNRNTLRKKLDRLGI